MNKYCGKCGKELEAGGRFCINCGAPAASVNTAPPQYSKQGYVYSAPVHSQYAPPPSAGRKGVRKVCIALAALLALQIVAVVLFGWPGIAVQSGGDDAGAAQTLGGASEGNRPTEGGGARPGNAPPPTPTPTPASEIMGEGIATMMARMSIEGSRIGINAGAAFGLPADMFEYNQMELAVTVTMPGSDSGEEIIYTQRDIIAENGGGEHSIRLDLMGESLDGGAWFDGESMIIRFGDASKPMIRYGLSETDAKASAGMIPMERYQLYLRADSPSAVIITDWNASLGNINGLLSAHIDDIAQSEAAIDAAGKNFDVQIQELALSGEEAAAAFGALIGAWESDLRSGDMLRIADLTAEKAYSAAAEAIGGQDEEDTEAPDTLERMSALLESEDASLTIKTGAIEGAPAMFELAYACTDGDLSLKLLFIDVATPYSSVELRLPGGDGYDYEYSGDAHARTITHTIYQPGGEVWGESIFTNTINDSETGFASEFSLELIDYGKEDVPGGERITSSGIYSHSSAGGAVNGSFEGELTMPDEEPIVYAGTLSLSEDYGEPEFPEFIVGSGVEAASRRELFELLHTSSEDGEDTAPKEIEEALTEFHATPMPLQSLLSNILLLGGL